MKEYTVKVHSCGTKMWYLNGRLHREDGPAIEWADGSNEWWLNGKRHREDGPAVEFWCGEKHWFLNDVWLSEEEFNARTKVKEVTINELEKLLGCKVKVVGSVVMRD